VQSCLVYKIKKFEFHLHQIFFNYYFELIKIAVSLVSG